MDTRKQEHKEIMNLLIRYKNGDKSAFEKLMQRTYESLYKLAFYYLRDRGHAEDIVIESYMKLSEKIEYINASQNVVGYLRIIVSNKCIDLKRRKRFEVYTEPEWFDTGESKSEDEDKKLVRDIIELIPQDEREVLVLKSHGYTLHEISGMTGKTVHQVRFLVEKGRKSFFEKYRKIEGGDS